MKLKLFATLTIMGTMLFSCNEEKLPENELSNSVTTVPEFDEGKVVLRDGILDFSTFEVYSAFSKKLLNEEKFRNLITERYGNDLLIGEVNKGTITNLQKHILENVPIEYSYILNKDGAYIVNNQYVRFGFKRQYFVSQDRINEIDWSKEDAIDLTKVKVFKYGKMHNDVMFRNLNARLDFHVKDENVGGDQAEFWQFTPASGWRKWVDEVDGVAIAEQWFEPFPNQVYARWRLQCVYRAKLEWKGSGSWMPASNYREITPNFTYSLQFRESTSLTPEQISAGTVGTTPIYGNGDWNYLLGERIHQDFYAPPMTGWQWLLSGSGSVTHRIVGDVASNDWVRTWTW